MPSQNELVNSYLNTVFDGIYGAFPDAVLFCNAKGEILVITPHGSGILEYEQEDLAGTALEGLLLPKFRAEFRERLAGKVAGDTDDGKNLIECRIHTRHHSSIPVGIRFAECNGKNGKPSRFVLVRDLRKKNMHEQQLIEDGRIVATGQLSSCVGHDISNPLSVIKLYAEWMSSELKDADRNNEDPLISHLMQSVNNIEDSADRIQEMISKMRNYARSTEQEVSEFELKDVVADALFYLDEQLCRASVRMETNLPDDDCLISAQPDQICQVFIHLIKNGCEALAGDAPPNHPVIQVGVQKVLDELGDSEFLFECTVSDNGCGMSEEVQDQMFAPFFSTKKRTNAAGLGLPVVRNIVRRHGGDIQVSSEPGEGAHVTFRLPACTEPAKIDSVG